MFQKLDLVTNQFCKTSDLLIDRATNLPILDERNAIIHHFSQKHAVYLRQTKDKSAYWYPGWTKFWTGRKFEKIENREQITKRLGSGKLILPRGFSADDPHPPEGIDTRFKVSINESLITRYGPRHKKLAITDIRHRWLRDWERFFDVTTKKFIPVLKNIKKFNRQVEGGQLFRPPNKSLRSLDEPWISISPFKVKNQKRIRTEEPDVVVNYI